MRLARLIPFFHLGRPPQPPQVQPAWATSGRVQRNEQHGNGDEHEHDEPHGQSNDDVQ